MAMVKIFPIARLPRYIHLLDPATIPKEILLYVKRDETASDCTNIAYGVLQYPSLKEIGELVPSCGSHSLDGAGSARIYLGHKFIQT